MRIVPGTALLVLAACSGPPATTRSADVNAAAAEAQGDIDTYAANALVARPPRTTVGPAATPVAAVVPRVAGSPTATKDVQAATEVAQRYVALLADRDFAQAYRLWDDNGRAAAPTLRAFMDGFARYADYRATLGPPGRVDAGAGQRYVELPVSIRATLAADQRPFAQRGTLTLHRTAAIDGATAARQRWHIVKVEVVPASPAAATAESAPVLPATVTARYRCAGTTRFSVRFDNQANTATLRRDGRPLAVLDGQRVGSGIWYKGDGYELRGKGDAADFTAPGQRPVACTADG